MINYNYIHDYYFCKLLYLNSCSAYIDSVVNSYYKNEDTDECMVINYENTDKSYVTNGCETYDFKEGIDNKAIINISDSEYKNKLTNN